MFENYSYKKKFLALVVIAIMLSIAAYKRSFHPLVLVIQEYNSLQLKDGEFNQKKHSIEDLQQEIANLDRQ